jgi:hypothetical protein
MSKIIVHSLAGVFGAISAGAFFAESDFLTALDE